MGCSRHKKSAALIGFVLSFLICSGTAIAACSDDRVTVRGEWGQAHFSVDVANDATERARGLMHVESMPMMQGMLFVYENPQRAGFWMRNTLIPLDMIFADSTGRVTRVHENAVPMDETVIDGGDGVQFVLEINGGMASRLGIVAGDTLRHPEIGANAEFPCE